MRKRWRIAIVVLVAGAALGIWYLLRPKEKAPGIFGSGTIEATEVDVSSEVGGKVVELTVEEGGRVKAGQVLARLDTSMLEPGVAQAKGAAKAAQAGLEELLAGSREEQIRQAQAAVNEARAAHEGARKALGIAEENYAKTSDLEAALEGAKAQRERAQAARNQAQARLEEVERGARSEVVEQARAALEQAQAALDQAESDLQRAERLHEEGALAGKDLDSARTAVRVARGRRDAAQAALDEAKRGGTEEQRRQARAVLDQAEAQLRGATEALRIAQQRYEDRLAAKQQLESARTQSESTRARVRALEAALDLLLAGARSETIRAARGQVEQAAAAVQQAENRLAQATVNAPCDGVVLTKVAEEGETVAAGQTILTVGDLSRPWLRIYVPEAQYSQVYLGQPARVQVDAIADRVFRGKVTAVAEQPEFTPRSAQTQEERAKLVFWVKIGIEEGDRRLKPGMPGEARLATDELGKATDGEQ